MAACLRHRDGSLRQVRLHATAALAGGRIARIHVRVHDAGESLRLEAARQAAARLLDVTADGFMHIDR
ncbi:MAG TPA: hypothetical protein VHI93_06350, partial [Candidatus Thermoplasmatota archaeon]|nr:hypothetical protein [Candidatus Thermoplasmatota archaeon]